MANKKRTERTLKQMRAKKEISKVAKAKNTVKIEGKKPASQLQLFEMQRTFSARVDASIMSTAAIAKLLVDKGVITWDEYKESYRTMKENLVFVRNTTSEAIAHFGAKANNEDIGAFIYEKGIAFGMDPGVLDGIFGARKSESRIIKPNQVKIIQAK